MSRSTMAHLLGVVVGSVCLIVSGVILIYFYAFSSMVDPKLQGTAYWRAVLGKMFGMFEGIVTWPMLLIFIASLGLIIWSTAHFVLSLVKKP